MSESNRNTSSGEAQASAGNAPPADFPRSPGTARTGAAAAAAKSKTKAKAKTRPPRRPPVIPHVQLDQLPATLRQYGHFLLWEFEFDDEAKDPAKEWRKVPKDAGSGVGASTTKPSTWTRYDMAVSLYEREYARRPGLVGFGYVFAKLDRKRFKLIEPKHVDELSLVDLDHCRDKDTGEIDGHALDIIRRLNSYSEESPSGTGVHVIVRGEVPRAYKTDGIEVYSFARFTTLTGRRIPDTPADINDAQEALDWLAERLEKDVPAALNGHYQATRDLFTRTLEPVKCSDKDLLDRIRRSKQGAKFRALYDDDGAWVDEYESQSEAVHALICILAFWTRKDAERVDRLFRESKLYSGKWLHKWDDPRGDVTLGICEIAAAFAFIGDKVYDERSGPDEQQQQQQGERSAEAVRFQLLTDVEAERLPPAQGILGDVLFEDTLAVLYGRTGRWKTFIALSMGLSIGSGQAWLGRPVKAGSVVYITAEGARGIGKRIHAWKRRHQVAGQTRLRVSRQVVHLLQPDQVEGFIASIREQLGDDAPGLIVIDTLARSLAGGSENNTQDAELLIAAADRIRRAFGCCVLFVHHSGYDQSHMRGNTVFSNDPDTVIRVVSDEDAPQLHPGEVVRLVSEKAKDVDNFKTITVTVELEIWHDDTDPYHDLTSLVVVAHDATREPHFAERLRVKEQRTLDIFHTLYLVKPEGVAFTEWQEAAMDTVDISKDTFRRYALDLVERRHVYHDAKGGLYHLPTGEWRDKMDEELERAARQAHDDNLNANGKA